MKENLFIDEIKESPVRTEQTEREQKREKEQTQIFKNSENVKGAKPSKNIVHPP